MTRSRETTEDGVVYRDLNGNGRMDPYEDPRLSPEERVADLLPRLSMEEKAGLLFHTMIGVSTPGAHDEPAGPTRATSRSLIAEKLLNHLNVGALPGARDAARWQNAIQELAEQTPHGIPVTFSTDPRHAFAENEGASFSAGPLSQWPDALGLAAIGSPDLVREFADIARREYLAVGIRAALHPQVDLATEPRWARQITTFGADAATASELVAAYLDGFQRATVDRDSVACTTKHFPGGGPLADGGDSHFVYGHDQVYPGGRFEEHLAPFRAAIAAGTSAIMPSYGVPRGLELDGEQVEEVAFGFNKRILTGLLREELGFDGVIVTDWGLITDVEVLGKPFPARAWGVEHLTPIERMAKIFDAGADQFGGEERTDLVLELVASGRIPESRIDEAAARLLLVKFQLGLFDDPYVDEDEAERIAGGAEFRKRGHAAQARSVTLLQNATVDERRLLPLEPGRRLYVEGIDPEVAAAYGEVVDRPQEADVVLLRLAAPFEPRDAYFLETMFHQGSLEFPASTAAHLEDLRRVAPAVVLDVALDRPAILTPLAPLVDALSVSFGASDTALLDAWSGRIAPEGKLPFELPRSMAAVEASRTDVPSDTADQLFPFGHGLVLGAD